MDAVENPPDRAAHLNAQADTRAHENGPDAINANDDGDSGDDSDADAPCCTTERIRSTHNSAAAATALAVIILTCAAGSISHIRHAAAATLLGVMIPAYIYVAFIRTIELANTEEDQRPPPTSGQLPPTARS